MARKKPFGKYTESEWRKNLTKLEAALGQKELAKRLGVNPSTINRWKRGETTPNENKIKQANRIYGHNKEKVTYTKLKKKLKQTKARKTAYKKAFGIVTESTRDWVTSHYPSQWVKESLLQASPVYAAYPRGNGERAQFMTPEQVLDKAYGKPPRLKKVRLYGIYTRDYLAEEDGEEDVYAKSDFLTPAFDMLNVFTKTMTLDATLDYLEAQFFSNTRQEGRIKYAPQTFLGYSFT